MAYTVSMHGLGVLLPLIKLVLVMYLACILQILIVYLLREGHGPYRPAASSRASPPR